MLCHCRNDKRGHDYQPHGYWGAEQEKDGKKLQPWVAACPAIGGSGIRKMNQPKQDKAILRATRRAKARVAP